MEINSVVIKRAASYEPRSGELVGCVCIGSGVATITVQLSDKAILNVLETIKEETRKEAENHALKVKNAFQDAITGRPTCLENQA